MDGISTDIERDASGRFVPGHSGNPAGKLPGTRNRKTVLMAALRDGEGEAAARVVIEKALAGDAVAARFVVGLISPKPRGRTIQLEMPEGDDCNVVTAFNVTLRALCNGEITPDEALQVSRFLDGRRRVLQAWQLEEKLTSYGRTIPGDPEWAPDDDDTDDEEDDAESDDDDDASTMQAERPSPSPPCPGESPLARSGASRLQKPCISGSLEGTIRDTPALPDESVPRWLRSSQAGFTPALLHAANGLDAPRQPPALPPYISHAPVCRGAPGAFS